MPKRLVRSGAPDPDSRRPRSPGTPARAARPAAQPAPASRTERLTSASVPRPGEVLISGARVHPIALPISDAFVAAAEEWPRIVLNRARWSGDDEARSTLADRCADLMASLGVNLRMLRAMAAGGILQVSIPFVREGVDWAPRIFPWEFVLTSATRDRCARSPLVVRRLVHAEPRPPAIGDPSAAMVVESAPGPFRQLYSFDSERSLVRACLGEGVRVLPDPSPIDLRRAIAEMHPGTIHLAGLDTHEGMRLLGMADPGFDGYLLSTRRLQPRSIRAEQLAALLAGQTDLPPRLVACNFQNSAARTAALCVAAGAEAAIGFQDVVDDATAELFFTRFYVHWADAAWRTGEAFRRTLDDLRSRPGVLSGLGIVFWSSRDIFADEPALLEGLPLDLGIDQPPDASADLDEPAPTQPSIADPSPGPATVTATPTTRDESLAATGSPQRTAVGDRLPLEQAGRRWLVPGRLARIEDPPKVWVQLDAVSDINYVHLHNNGSLFNTFRIRRSTGTPLRDVEIEVRLFVGRHSFPYRSTLVLTQPVTELRDQIHIPLTSELLRTVHEAVQSVVYIRVRHGVDVIYEDTHRVMVQSADEWVDNDQESRWLPSFVLPRDPAVDQIRRDALAALRYIREDRNAGFEGYPDGDSIDDTLVDDQAKAIWSTLSYQYGFSYISPPPTYTDRAQRLRTPSEVVRTRSGTCVDLALLYASCLELIDLYPVVCLYRGHANVGYWRTREAHAQFQVFGMTVGRSDPAQPNAPEPETPARRQGAHSAQLVPWEANCERDADGNLVDDSSLREVIRRERSRDLAILEATWLTQQQGFGGAGQKGAEALTQRAFRSLIDIHIARRRQVTPLPIVFEPSEG